MTQLSIVGSFAPLFSLPDQNGQRGILRDKAGSPLLIVFYANDGHDDCRRIACELNAMLPKLQAHGVQVFSISCDPPEARQAFAAANQLSYPLLCDVDMAVSRQYRVCQQNEQTFVIRRSAFLISPNLQVMKVYTPILEASAFIRELQQDLPLYFPPQEKQFPQGQAPVLLIPNVLDPAFCRSLIEVWQTQGNEDSGFMRRDPEDPNKTIGVLDYGMKIRRDHFVRDEALKATLDSVMKQRVFPEIQKCFNYEATRREEYKISCYDSDIGGYFRKHRDNTTGGTAHRRWAMTLNLNTEAYEGGYLHFPEYGPYFYRPETGSAIIFSGSMMHEATDVTAGQRFALLNFFYGEKESEQRQQYETQMGIENYKPLQTV